MPESIQTKLQIPLREGAPVDTAPSFQPMNRRPPLWSRMPLSRQRRTSRFQNCHTTCGSGNRFPEARRREAMRGNHTTGKQPVAPEWNNRGKNGSRQ